MVGAWCFVEHYGPDEVAGTGGMDVHDEIVEFREERETGSERFGRVEGCRGDSDSQDRINWFVSHVAASSRLDGERDTSTSVTCGG